MPYANTPTNTTGTTYGPTVVTVTFAHRKTGATLAPVIFAYTTNNYRLYVRAAYLLLAAELGITPGQARARYHVPEWVVVPSTYKLVHTAK